MDRDNKTYEHWKFGGREEEAEHLLSLVISGVKTATTSLFQSYLDDGEALPKIGDISIITHWDGLDACMVETTHVDVLPFSEVSEEMCLLEGEGNSLAEWRKTHIDFFLRYKARKTEAFDPSTLIVFEQFKIIEVLE